MIPNLRLNGTSGRAAGVAVLALLAALSASCEKAPLTAPTGTTIRLTANTQVLGINGTVEIVASVLESGGYAVHNGTMVTFTTTLGTVTPSEVGTTNGKATTTFNAGTQAGTAVINAYSGSNSTSGSTTTGTGGATTTTGSGVTIVIGAAAANTLVLTASPSSLSQTGGTSVITATVYDTNNNALPGVQVSFSTDQGTLSPVMGVTNGFGQAQTSLTTNQTATVTATAGAKTGTAKVTTTALPTVTLTGPTTTPTAGLTSTFSLTVAAGSGSAPIRSVVVDFGDGQSMSLGAATGTVSVPHVYQISGSFTVTATALDASGQTTSMAIPIVVYPSVPFTLTVTGPSGRVGTPINLTAVPAAGSPAVVSYTWNFGDGTLVTTTVAAVSHIYTSIPAGYTSYPYVVTVTAIGVDGRGGIGSTSVLISP
jgi:large repetitive protein